MRISRIRIENFRNFSSLDVRIGRNAVLVGENKIGKSNLLHALRLIFDPSLPDSARRLRDEDFWDGLQRPLKKDCRIVVAVDISEFEQDEHQLAVLAEYLVEHTPMVARLTYTWRPILGLDDDPKSPADYEFIVFGGDRPENRVSYEVRQRLPLELLPALRDCEGDLARWTKSPLRSLLDKAANEIDLIELEELAAGIESATNALAGTDKISNLSNAITQKLTDMVGSEQALETVLRFSPTDSSKLIRALRIFIDGGKRGVSDASVGSANLLYLALKALEYDQLVEEGDRDHTFFAIEEPEAHLHPNLQRLIFRNYLKTRLSEPSESSPSPATILLSTHSPHIASVTPVRDFVVLRRDSSGNATEAVSTAALELSEDHIADLERYLDVQRGEVLFARGVILVEGDAERFLVPVLAAQQGYDLDELGISLCSVSGTNFEPYLKLFGSDGLDIPLTAFTDFDPLAPKEDGTERTPLGPNRIVNQMLVHLVSASLWGRKEFDELLELAPTYGLYLNNHTFEVDLFESGLQISFAEAMESLDVSRFAKKRMKDWANKPATLDIPKFLRDIEAVGKGRFAQRLASIIVREGVSQCPDYILNGVKHVAFKCQRS